MHIHRTYRVCGKNCGRVGRRAERQDGELTACVDDDRSLRDVEVLIVLYRDDVVAVYVEERGVCVKLVFADAFAALSRNAVTCFVEIEVFSVKRFNARLLVSRAEDFRKHVAHAYRGVRKLIFADAEREFGVGIAVHFGVFPGVNGDLTSGDDVNVAFVRHGVVFNFVVTYVVNDCVRTDRINRTRIESVDCKCERDGNAFAFHIFSRDAVNVVFENDFRTVCACGRFCGDDRSALDDAVIDWAERLIAALVHSEIVGDVSVVVFGNINVDFVVAGLDGHEIHGFAVRAELGFFCQSCGCSVFFEIEHVAVVIDETIDEGSL